MRPPSFSRWAFCFLLPKPARITEAGFSFLALMNPIKLEYRAVDALIPYARNAKQHSEAQVAQIAASIREFGWGRRF